MTDTVSLFHYDDPTAEERASQNGYVEFNKKMKQWYMDKKEEVDSKTFPIHQAGDTGLGIPIPELGAIKLAYIKP